MEDEFQKIFGSMEDALDYEAPADVKESFNENLRGTFERALEDASSIDDMWTVFREHMTSVLLDRAVIREPLQAARTQLVAHLWHHERSVLIERAAIRLAQSNHSAVVDSAVRHLLSVPSLRKMLEEMAIDEISKELRPKIHAQLTAELKVDPSLIDEVKREIKRKIMDL
jgi:hypothetical protein